MHRVDLSAIQNLRDVSVDVISQRVHRQGSLSKSANGLVVTGFVALAQLAGVTIPVSVAESCVVTQQQARPLQH